MVGTAACLWSLIDTYLDRASLRREEKIALRESRSPTNGSVRVILRMNLRSARASLLLHTFFLALGIFALSSPNARFTITLGILGGAYILVAATNARAITLNQLDRVRERRAAGRQAK